MGEVIDHAENCFPSFSTKLSEIHESITTIANLIGTINLDEIGNSMVGKMLGLGKK